MSPFKLQLHRLCRRLLAGLAIFMASLSVSMAAVHPVKGFLPDLHFALQSAQGPVTEKSLLGKVTLMFFGYASCPDICPTTMAQLAMLVDSLGSQSDQVQVVFVSVDPHRDTPEILQAYVDAFDTNAIGLSGDEDSIADLARRYRVAYQIEKPKSDQANAAYEVSHSRGVYAFDKQGKAVWLASDSESQDDLYQALQPLLN